MVSISVDGIRLEAELFDITLLARRLVGAVDWLAEEPATSALPTGCFGASTGAGRLSEEPGALDRVAGLASDWFARHLGR